jgi:uncharacterized protein (TIGR00255 family)
MKSMTGYGRSKKSGSASGKALLTTSCDTESWARSVNGRFLEIRLHLPREWAELEPEVRSLAQKMLSRGTVDLHVYRVRGAESSARVEIDERLAQEWAKALQKLAQATGSSASSFPFEVIAKAPDVIRVVNETELTSEQRAIVLDVAKEALVALEIEKNREGASIRTELLSLLSQLDAAVVRVSKLALDAPDDLRTRLKTRMDRLEASGLQPPGADDSRFHQEVAILIDRGDIREEIARLSAHLTVYRELVEGADTPTKGAKSEVKKSDAQIGKTLDFYAQELLREVNTVGSKSQTAELTRLVVEAKTLVEKIREQVQNVE